MSALPTAGAIVNVIVLPLIETPVTERLVLPVETVNALASGAVPASASLNTSVRVVELTEAETRLGATVSVVLLTTATGPKFALSFSVGAAMSRTRSPAVEGCE